MYFDNNRPIYVQTVEDIKLDIIAGRYHAGDKLPTVRELAAQYRINPNTMQRSFAQLEAMHLVHTERGNGRYVCDDPDVIRSYRDEMLLSKAKEFLHYMDDLGVKDDALLLLLRKARKGDEK